MYERLKRNVLPELIPPGARILVAVSGGPDSMALAHVLRRYAQEEKEQEISLVISHVHHGVRPESDEEEQMVRNMARDWQVPCFIHHFDSKAYAQEMGLSFQTAARQWRYQQWQKDMEKESCTHLATAHHLGDQAETILYRLLRGAGTAGLGGIYPQQGILIRPFLTVTKEEIITYCHKEGIPYALDYSNEDPIYVRNQIRLQLIPLLEKDYNPNILEALGKTAEILRWDEEYLREETEKFWARYLIGDHEKEHVNNDCVQSPPSLGLRKDVFQLPKAILSRLLRKGVAEVTGEPRGIGYDYVEKIMASQGRTGWQQDLPGVTIRIDYDGIWFFNTKIEEKKQESGREKAKKVEQLLRKGHSLLQLPQPVDFNEWYTWEDHEGQWWQVGLFTEEPTDQEGEILQRVVFDAQALFRIKKDLIWRYRQGGDRLLIPGLGRKTLKKIFQENKVSSSQRERIPLLVAKEEILWIPGIKKGASYKKVDEQEVVLGILRKI